MFVNRGKNLLWHTHVMESYLRIKVQSVKKKKKREKERKVVA